METRLIINQFDELDTNVQRQIQDFICGETTNWSIELFTHCDACGEEKELERIDTEGGVIRICKDCKIRRLKEDENKKL